MLASSSSSSSASVGLSGHVGQQPGMGQPLTFCGVLLLVISRYWAVPQSIGGASPPMP